MDPITQQVVLATAGSAADPPTYVDDVFSTYVYEGNGSAQTITNGIDLSGEGGLVWIKSREVAYNHRIYDTERGVTKELAPNTDGTEFTVTDGLTHFLSNGFTISSDVTINKSGIDNAFVSWTFRKAPGFCDVVTYSGDTENNQTIAHSLGSKPGMILIKNLTNQHSWAVFHEEIPVHDHLKLNTFGAAHGSNYFVNEPTSTHFTVVGGEQSVNITNNQYVAYLFANDDARFGTNSDEPIIKCGTYYGNGSTQEIDLGFEPQWLMIKNVSSLYDAFGNADWFMVDIMRGMTTENSRFLVANETDAEDIGGIVVPTTTGFKILTQGNIGTNANGDTYIYMAIRRPNKPPTTGTDVFALSGAYYLQNAGFPIDTKFSEGRATTEASNNFFVFDRLRSGFYLVTSEYITEQSATGAGMLPYDIHRNKVGEFYNNVNITSYAFRRAPGFFDTVLYDGNSVAGTAINHGLKAVPELIIVKSLNRTGSWATYSSATGASHALYLDVNSQATTTDDPWNSTAPTAQQFSLGSIRTVNTTGFKYIAYLFATLPGISKVGSYSGNTGNDVNVDCGFSTGPRLVIIKRTDNVGSWYWISGIYAGDDNFNFLDIAVGRQTAGSPADYIDPSSNGFTITSSAPANMNATGGTYLFLAIA